jgi:hypothetical protein
VQVHIDSWDGPERVEFTFTLENDPVKGNGSYVARALSENTTELVLNLQVHGSGPMAPIWEAMGRPLLPQLLRTFCQKLKAEIELSAAASTDSAAQLNAASGGGPDPADSAVVSESKGLWRKLTLRRTRGAE